MHHNGVWVASYQITHMVLTESITTKKLGILGRCREANHRNESKWQNPIFLCRSSQSTVSNTNKYESREKINTAAQRTLLIDSGSETDSHVYERYAAVRSSDGRKGRVGWEKVKGANQKIRRSTERKLSKQMMGGKRLGREWKRGGDFSKESIARKMDKLMKSFAVHRDGT